MGLGVGARVRGVEDASTRDGGGRGICEIAYLEDHAHVGQQPDAFVGGEGKQPVVVHDAVHVLDPVGVEVAVEHDPLGVGVGRIGEVAHHAREQPILPLTRCDVDESVELVGGERLRVEGWG